MPNGKVMFTYVRDSGTKTEQEFVFAEHAEFSYDYNRSRLLLHINGQLRM